MVGNNIKTKSEGARPENQQGGSVKHPPSACLGLNFLFYVTFKNYIILANEL